jgi:hypothetical protein
MKTQDGKLFNLKDTTKYLRSIVDSPSPRFDEEFGSFDALTITIAKSALKHIKRLKDKLHDNLG